MEKQDSLINYIIANKSKIVKNYFYYKNVKINLGIKLKNNEEKALIFLSLDSPIHFSNFFKVSRDKLLELINDPEYASYTIPKKKGGKRSIESPSEELKLIQNTINYHLQHYYLNLRPTNIHGFIIKNPETKSSYNIIENARLHIKSKYVLTIDLQNFFSSITGKRVYSLFSSGLFDFSDESAKALTFLCTYKGILPTGSPASPVLSNFICLELDRSLLSFCIEKNIIYSRYADDLSFSSNSLFTEELLNGLKSIIVKHHFKINEKKVRLKSTNRRQIVTGLVVNEKVNINRKILKLVRAILNDCKKNGIENACANHYKLKEKPSLQVITKFQNKLRGHINFIKQVRGEDFLYQRLKNELDSHF